MTSQASEKGHQKAIAARLADYQARRTQRYAAVNVILLTWVETDIGPYLMEEVTELSKMFRDVFNYAVWPYKIPSLDAERSLNLAIAQFIKSFGHEDNLLIVYYSGHGGPRVETKGPCTWAAYVPSPNALPSSHVNVMSTLMKK